MTIGQMALNTLIFSIPEEFFITMITLMMFGKHAKCNYMSKQFWKENLCKIMFISVIPTSIFSDVLKNLYPNNHYLILFNTIFFIITIWIIKKIEGQVNILYIILIPIFGILIFMIIEMSTMLLLQYILKGNINFNQSITLKFILTIPERAIQYLILFILFLKQNALSEVKLIKTILKNKILTFYSILISFVLITILIIINKYVIITRSLQVLPLSTQMIISVSLLVLMIFLLLSIWIISLCIYPVEKYKQKYK